MPPSVTTWTRLEPRARGTDMRPSLEARVHDPLWLLGRQWQVGEFQGEDAGSPIFARLRGRADLLSAWRAGPAPTDPVDGYDATSPLEALVEREAPPPDRRLAAEAGLHFLRMLAEAGLGTYRQPFLTAYPLQPPMAGATIDPASVRFLAVMAHRAPDGDLLAEALRGPVADGALPATVSVPPADLAGVLAVAGGWLGWVDKLVDRPAAGGRTWQPERMEYGFAAGLSSGGQALTLAAQEYTGGRLDWHSFSVDRASPMAVTPRAEDVVATALAAPASYPGMPTRRWWQFEDAPVNLGELDAAPEDLARLLLAEFASVYGNDWYVLPVDLPVGSLTTVSSLVVLDTFGDRTLVDRAEDLEWSMFELSHSDARPGAETRDGRLFLAPTLGTSLESEPVEEVLLARDELANLAWAVERVVQGPAGRRVDRFEAWQARRALEAELAGPNLPSEHVAYRLMTQVPEHWIPLIPEELEPGAVRLRRGAMRRPVLEGAPEEWVDALGQILEPWHPLTLHEEEVPREGAQVIRAWQYVRWIDGSTHLWLGRRKRPGRGGSSSGLRFDLLVEPSPQE